MSSERPPQQSSDDISFQYTRPEKLSESFSAGLDMKSTVLMLL